MNAHGMMQSPRQAAPPKMYKPHTTAERAGEQERHQDVRTETDREGKWERQEENKRREKRMWHRCSSSLQKARWKVPGGHLCTTVVGIVWDTEGKFAVVWRNISLHVLWWTISTWIIKCFLCTIQGDFKWEERSLKILLYFLIYLINMKFFTNVYVIKIHTIVNVKHENEERMFFCSF